MIVNNERFEPIVQMKVNKNYQRFCWNANTKNLLGRNVHCLGILLPLHFT